MRRWSVAEPAARGSLRTRAPVRLVPAVAAFVVGALLGLAASVAVNAALVEVSVTPWAAALFAVLFLSVAALLLWRTWGAAHPQAWVLRTFAGVLAAAGLLCLTLQQRWMVDAAPAYKVPVYTLVGAAVSFTLLFALVDVLNYLSSLRRAGARPLIQTETQVYLVAATAALMGALFGLVFGLVDVEDQPPAKIRAVLAQEERLCYPVGALLAGAAAVVNERLRAAAAEEYEEFDPVYDDELEYEY